MKTKDEALQQVRDNNQQEYQKLYLFASAWVKTCMKPFTSEDVKQAFYDAGNPIPRQLNVFGAVINALAKERAIKKNGVATAKCPSAHRRLLHQWISHEYSLKQSTNRKLPDYQVSLLDLTE